MKNVALLALLASTLAATQLPAQATPDDAKAVADLIEKARRYNAGPMSKKVALGALRALGAYGWRARGALPGLVELCGSSDAVVANAAGEAIDRIAKASADLKEVDTAGLRKEVAESKKAIEQMLLLATKARQEAERVRQLKEDAGYRVAVLPFTHTLQGAADYKFVVSKAVGGGRDVIIIQADLLNALQAAPARLADDLLAGMHVRVPTRAQTVEAARGVAAVVAGRKLKAQAVITGEVHTGPVLVVRCVEVETGHLMWKKAMPFPASALATLEKAKAIEEAYANISARLKRAAPVAAPDGKASAPKKPLSTDVVAVLPPVLPAALSEAAKKELRSFSLDIAHDLINGGKLRLVPPARVAALAKATPEEAGRGLGAGAVLALDVAVSGKDVVITAQLIETETGFLMWRDQSRCDMGSRDLGVFVNRTVAGTCGSIHKRLGK